MIGFLIGAGVGLLAGAGLGILVAALAASIQIEAARKAARDADAARVRAERRAAVLKERCDGYVGELDALVEATRPAAPAPDFGPGVPCTCIAGHGHDAPWGCTVCDCRHYPPLSGLAEDVDAVGAERAVERFMAEDAVQQARPHRPGMAIYPRYTKED